MDVSVLFIDHDSSIQESLRCITTVDKNVYLFHFASNEQDASKVLAAEKVDIIIWDILQIINNGFSFLNHVAQQYPHLIRILIAGDSSQEQALKSTVPVHHFFNRPADVMVIKKYIDRITAVRNLLGSDTMQRLSTRVVSLPSLPGIFYELMEEMEKPEPSIPKISRLIETDSFLTARIIQLVNSASMGVAHRINDVGQAITLLGLDMTRTLIVYVGMHTYLHSSAPILYTAEAINSQGLLMGRVAYAICLSETGSISQAREAMMAGILNNLGYLLLLNNPQIQSDIRNMLLSASQTLMEAEQMLTGVTHAEIGAYFLGIRGFDEDLLEAVAFYYRPGVRPALHFNTLTALHAASVLTPSPLNSVIPCKKSSFDIQYLDKLGLLKRIDSWQTIACEVMAHSSPYWGAFDPRSC